MFYDQVYATVLTLLTPLLPMRVSRVCSTHATVILIALFSSFAYRDIWPVLTVHLHPLDASEGAILWFKVAYLVVGAILIPLMEPYPYIPLNGQVSLSWDACAVPVTRLIAEKEPQTDVNPEQTASLISFLSYAFLDRVVAAAHRVPHLPSDRFPPLCDFDYAKNLIQQSYRVSLLSERQNREVQADI
jgi:hypothetical protein